MIDDFDVVPPPAETDPDDEERFRPLPPRDPEDEYEWRSEFRSYLDDPV